MTTNIYDNSFYHGLIEHNLLNGHGYLVDGKRMTEQKFNMLPKEDQNKHLEKWNTSMDDKLPKQPKLEIRYE